VLSEVVFATLRILMDPMQLNMKDTCKFLCEYMGRDQEIFEEDRRAA